MAIVAPGGSEITLSVPPNLSRFMKISDSFGASKTFLLERYPLMATARTCRPAGSESSQGDLQLRPLSPSMVNNAPGGLVTNWIDRAAGVAAAGASVSAERSALAAGFFTTASILRSGGGCGGASTGGAAFGAAEGAVAGGGVFTTGAGMEAVVVVAAGVPVALFEGLRK